MSVDDAVCTASPEAPDQNVIMVFLATVVSKEAFDWVILAFVNPVGLQDTAVQDFWFVAKRGGGKGFGSEVTQLVSDLIVARDDKTACFALKCMANAKVLKAAITVQ
jgi:hypothetical protein